MLSLKAKFSPLVPQWDNNNTPTYFLEGEAAVRRILEAKKQEVQSDLTRSMDYAQMAEKGAEDRKRIREEKQRQARQQAIQVSVIFEMCLAVLFLRFIFRN